MRRSQGIRWIAGLLLAASVVACAPPPAPRASQPGVVAAQPAAPASREHAFSIAPGTAAARVRGEGVRMLPERVDMRVGDTLVIDNQDDTFHTFGWFAVGPHQHYARQFGEPGTTVLFDWGCAGGTGASTTIVVTAP